MRAALLSLVVLAAVLSGCTHPCLALAEEMCECSDNELEKEICKEQMRDAFGKALEDDRDAAKDECTALIDQCDCAALETEEGKRACGRARTP